jgi:hypothetical protein
MLFTESFLKEVLLPFDAKMSIPVATNFYEIAFRAPRPGFFVGDYVIDEDGALLPDALNPIVKQYHPNYSDISPAAQSSPALGSLTRLPTEIMHSILSHLDVLSVLDFSRVNGQAVALVKSSLDFEIVASFPKALSAVIEMQCRFYTLGRLALTISDPRCGRCSQGHFGELLYLITAERVCWPCWRRFPEYIPKLVKDGRDAGFSDDQLNAIPHVKAVPGRYGFVSGLSDARIRGRVFDRRAFAAALQATFQQQDSDPEPDRAEARTPESPEAAGRLAKRMTKPSVMRCLSFIRAPYWDREMLSYVGGYFCRACIGRNTYRSDIFLDRNWKFPTEIWHEPWRRYTKDGFCKHVDKYGPIVKDVGGTYAHDSERRETRTPDDIQWEMYHFESVLLADGMDLPDDRPLIPINTIRKTSRYTNNCQ